MSLIAITAKTIYTPLEVVSDAVIVVEDHAIRSIGPREAMSVPEGARSIDLGDKTIAPGFIDIHVHGGGGHDVMEGTLDALSAVARLAARHGTTSFVPTTMTAPMDALLHSLSALGKHICSWASAAANEPLAQPLGIHMEGPFISSTCRGVHPNEFLQRPSPEVLLRLVTAAQGTARIVTVAPELEGAIDTIAAARRLRLRVGLGHSNATFEEALKGIEAGATHAVHTFNAMRPFAHRDTGILGAVLTDHRLQAEVIADGIHVSAPALKLLVRSKGITNIILVTDAVSATGMAAGRYRLGGIEIDVEADDAGRLVCRNIEGKLAGSVLSQDCAVRNMVADTGVTLREAVTMATWNPARLLGIEDRKGCLRAGADADLVIIGSDGRVVGTMTRGIGNFF
jgi:N-acetylglucosamine-6-phosphate deacetylase